MTAHDDNRSLSRTDEQENEGPILEWTAHPLRRKPLAAVLVTIFIIATGFLVFITTQSKTFGTLALVVLFASLAKFYMPTRYRLTDKRLMVKSTTQTQYKNWSQYRTYYPDKNGVLLSPFLTPSRLENFRGLYLLFEQNRDEVIAFVKAHIGTSADESTEISEERK